MTQAADAPPRRFWLKPALIVSIAINLVFVGLIASFFWKHPYGGPRTGKFERIATVIEEFIPALPDAKREAASAQLSRFREESMLLTEKVQELRKLIRQHLTAENYDETKLRETLELIRAARAEQGRSMSEAALLVVRDLSREKRGEFLETMQSRKYGHRGERRPDKDK